jgi:hypothetical protein
MMKAESISRVVTPNDLPVERQGSAGKSEEDFRALLEVRSSMVTQFSSFQETPPGPMCSSGCWDSSSPGAVDFGKAAAVYCGNAVLYQPGQSESGLVAGEGGPLIDLQRSDPSAFGAEKIRVRSGNDSPSPPESTGGFSRILSEIKDFLVGLFSPQGISSGAPETVAKEKVAETASNDQVARFFHLLGTLLSFGLWRPEESQDSGKASKDAMTKASVGGDGSIEGHSLTSASSRQNLPVERGESAGSEVGGITRSIPLKVPAKIREAIQEAAHKYDLSADLIAALIRVESNFDPGAVSKEGAGGLMQLMPSTAKALEVRNRFDIRQNIDGGCRYLKSLLERFGGQVELALAAYNAGPEAVERYDGIPPYRHTRHYVKKVLAYC